MLQNRSIFQPEKQQKLAATQRADNSKKFLTIFFLLWELAQQKTPHNRLAY